MHKLKQQKCSQQICLAGPTLIAAVPTETSPETVLTLGFFNQAPNLYPVQGFSL